MVNETLFYRNGTAFDGTPVAQGKRLGVLVTRRCGRCGGAGGAEQWRHTGWKCYDCGGTGTRGQEFQPVYTAEKLAKLNASGEKRDAKRAAKQQEVAAAKAAERASNTERFNAEHASIIARAEGLAVEGSILADLLSKGRQYGSWSEKQLALVVSICDRLEADAVAKAASGHVGTVGERLEVAVKVARIASYERPSFRGFGRVETVWIVTMVDAAGNQIVSKTPNFNEEVGTSFVLRATVKAHDEYKGTRQTVVNRPVRKAA